MSSGTIPIFLTSKISSKTGTNPVPTGTMFTFFALPNPNLNNLPDQGELFLDDFSARLTYVDNLGQQKDEFVPLHGPVGFVVPEPFSMLLYLFGGFFLSLLAKLKAK
ncbi:MAG: hypothetical protein H7A34_07950 [bacterium]|nr:hypothetical protein [bacterium]